MDEGKTAVQRLDEKLSVRLSNCKKGLQMVYCPHL